MSEEGAGCGVVTDNPILVGAPRRGYGDRILPGESVGRTACDDCVLRAQGKRGDDPDIVRGIESDRCITGASEGSTTLKYCDAGKESASPRRATVDRGGKADVGSAAAEDASYLECTHN